MTALNDAAYICNPCQVKQKLKSSLQLIQMIGAKRVPILYYQFPANSAFPTKIELESTHQNFKNVLPCEFGVGRERQTDSACLRQWCATFPCFQLGCQPVADQI